MELQNVLNTIETEFQDNWVGNIHFASSIKEPISDEWINVDVIPINSEIRSYEGCSKDLFGLYVTCYAKNKAKAYILADSVTQFIANRLIGDFQIGNARPVNQVAVQPDRYYIRIMFYIKN